jgi:hypothetical protein
VRRFPRAVLCGVVRWRGSGFEPHLNPPGELVVAPDDRLVLVAPSYEDTLASSERFATGEEADTRAVVACLLLEELLENAPRPPRILVELQDPDNEPLLAGRGAEVIVTPLILAHMIAQVALRRELRAVFDSLFTAGGPELAFRTPGVALGSWRVDELQLEVRRRGEILLGLYRTESESLVLAPPRDTTVTVGSADQLVVITTDP